MDSCRCVVSANRRLRFLRQQEFFTCNAPIGWEEIAAATEGKILVIGEPHGTNEVPQAFLSYVCAASKRGVDITVALEISEKFQSGLRMASEAQDKQTSLLQNLKSHWAVEDGRGSIAMFDLINELYKLKGVKIIPIQRSFELTPPEGLTTDQQMFEWSSNLSHEFIQQKADESYAAAVLDSWNGQHDETMIVLVGNIHAAKAELGYMPNVKPMGMLLPQDSVVSFKIQHAGGTAWVSGPQGTGPVDYGRDLTITPQIKDQPEMGMSQMLEPHYDGYFYIGSISASAPKQPR